MVEGKWAGCLIRQLDGTFYCSPIEINEKLVVNISIRTYDGIIEYEEKVDLRVRKNIVIHGKRISLWENTGQEHVEKKKQESLYWVNMDEHGELVAIYK